MRPPDHFYRHAQGLRLSTLGLGTYLGAADDATDRGYEAALRAAIEAGITVIDTAINYRHQRSERAIGAVLRSSGRDGLVVCTKAGFLTPGASPPWLRDEHTVGGMHSMHPDFVADQVDRSRANLGVEVIDVFYLHNPEVQLRYVDPAAFEARLRAACERLERLAEEGSIRWYGLATWDGFRKPGLLDLERIASIGAPHLKFIQLPFNLAMVEALPVLTTAGRLGITVVASASLLQSRLVRDLPEALAEAIPSLETDAQRAIQFTRSTPGIAVALAGMSRPEHVIENLGVARVPPLDAAAWRRIAGPGA
jgi:aryl-alcohol dehydrogenase-like predicted oxidoreductase